MKYNSIFFLVVLLMISYEGIAQDLIYEQFTTDDGLPSNTIYEIVQDSNGLIWMGTEAGLVSYDGTEFSTYSNPRLKDNDIIELEISKDGHITFSNIGNQYCRLEGDSLVIVEIQSNGFIDLISNKKGDFIFENSGVRDTDSRSYVLSYAGYSDTVYNRDYSAIALLKDETFLILREEAGTSRLKSREGEIFVFEEETVVDMLILPNGRGLYRSECCDYIAINRSHHKIPKNLVSNSLLSKLNYYVKIDFLDVFAYDGGLEVLDRQSKVSAVYFDGYKVNYVYSDIENNLWISTTGQGLIRIPSLSNVIYSYDHFQHDIDGVKLIDSFLYINTLSDFVSQNTFVDVMKRIELPSPSRRILIERAGKLYVYFGGGKAVINGYQGSFTRWESEFLDDFSPRAVIVANENLVLGSRQILVTIDTVDVNVHIGFEDFEVNRNLTFTNSIYFDSVESKIYVGSNYGLVSFFTYSLSNITKYEFFDEMNISSLQLASDRLVVGTANNGVYEANLSEPDLAPRSIDCLQGMACNNMDYYAPYLFVATNDGVVRYNENDSTCSVVSEFEGLPSAKITQVIVKNLDSIYVVIDKSVVLLSNEFFDKKQNILKLFVDNVFVNSSIWSGRLKGNTFGHDQNDIVIGFDFYTYRSHSGKRLKYKFNDDNDWSYTPDFNIRMSSLQSGDYSLQVVGLAGSREVTETELIEFTIAPPWYRALWARILGVFVFLLALFVLYHFRIARIKKQELLRRRYDQEINNIKDQALQLQMNPHFIFNAMNAIQNFITSNSEENAIIYLARFAKLIRLIFQYSNSNLITLDQEIEFVRLYLDLERLRFQDKIVSTLTVSEQVEAENDLLRIPPLLIQPIIENSFKHGLFHKISGGILSIRYELEGRILVVVVEDNGIGRAASAKLKGGAEESNRNSGLRNIRERIKMLNFNNLSSSNELIVQDVLDNGIVAGTRTIMKIELRDNLLGRNEGERV